MLLVCLGMFALTGSTANAAFPGSTGLLAYDSKVKRGDHMNHNDVFTYDTTTGEKTDLTANLPGVRFAYFPSWSADGSRIVFIATVNGANEYWVMDADGANAYPITRPLPSLSSGFPLGASFSPDGTRVVYGDGNGLAIVPTDGSLQSTTLTDRGGAPAWSPDGTKIAFNDLAAGAPAIFFVRPDGTHLGPLAKSHYDFDPDWAPDGGSLVFLHGDAGHSGKLFTQDANGSNRGLLANVGRDVHRPVFTPDGTALEYEVKNNDCPSSNHPSIGGVVTICWGHHPSWQPLN